MNQPAQSQASHSAEEVSLTTGKAVSGPGAGTEEIVPPAKDGTKSASSQELPTLPAPALAAGGSIALDILLDAIGDKVRTTETNAGIATVKANAEAREATNKEKIAKIQEQIDKLEEAGFWSKVTSVFKYIGMALAAAGCVAMIATGVGSAAGVAGLTLIGVSIADSILDEIGTAVNGQGWGLTSGIGKLIEKISGSKEAGMWVKLGLDVTISIAALVCSCGASASSTAGNLEQTAQTASKVALIAKSTVDVTSSGTTIASSVYTYEASKAQADQKRLQAILENIQMVNELVTKHMKQVIEDSQKTAETVGEIVKENTATQTAILTEGGGTAMA